MILNIRNEGELVAVLLEEWDSTLDTWDIWGKYKRTPVSQVKAEC